LGTIIARADIVIQPGAILLLEGVATRYCNEVAVDERSSGKWNGGKVKLNENGVKQCIRA